MDIQWIDTEEKGWETSRQRRHIGSRHGNRQQSTTILPLTHNDLEMIFLKRELLIFMTVRSIELAVNYNTYCGNLC